MERYIIWPVTVLVLLSCISTDASPSNMKHMNEFIEAIKEVEEANPGLKPIDVMRSLRSAAGLTDAFLQHFLGGSSSHGAVMEAGLSDYFAGAIRHRVTKDAREEGVVLAADGTTVALRPLLLGIEVGLLSKTTGSVEGLYPLTLARDLALSFGDFRQSVTPQRLGPDGCWDDISTPVIFRLSGPVSRITTAMVNGGMDGVMVGMEVSSSAQSGAPAVKLSSLLSSYYCQRVDRTNGSSDAAPVLVSQRRRENFRELVRPPILARQVVSSTALQRRLAGQPKMDAMEEKELTVVVNEGMNEFVHKYMDCPAIVPRCMWGARPYRGTPTLLNLPLAFLYIHHTGIPSQPCLTFDTCSANMRAMQRYHQDERGWADIGYSFVAGADGNIYEGRGWEWQGAHTKGHNDEGYGVSFIGDYSSSLPSQRAVELVRDRLTSCAVGGGRLVAQFTIQGHRQVVDTDCPGDAFYGEITGWEHWGSQRMTSLLHHMKSLGHMQRLKK